MNSYRLQQVLTLVLGGIACLVLAPSLNAQTSDSKQISDLLSLAKVEAVNLREDANQMQQLVLDGVTWDTQAHYAKSIAEDIIEMRATIDQLNKTRSSGSAWQKAAIDQINPLMKELARTSEEVFNTMGKKPSDKTLYNDYLEANFDHAEHLAGLISESVSYGKARVRLEKAAEKLNSSQNAN